LYFDQRDHSKVDLKPSDGTETNPGVPMNSPTANAASQPASVVNPNNSFTIDPESDRSARGEVSKNAMESVANKASKREERPREIPSNDLDITDDTILINQILTKWGKTIPGSSPKSYFDQQGFKSLESPASTEGQLSKVQNVRNDNSESGNHYNETADEAAEESKNHPQPQVSSKKWMRGKTEQTTSLPPDHQVSSANDPWLEKSKPVQQKSEPQRDIQIPATQRRVKAIYPNLYFDQRDDSKVDLKPSDGTETNPGVPMNSPTANAASQPASVVNPNNSLTLEPKSDRSARGEVSKNAKESVTNVASQLQSYAEESEHNESGKMLQMYEITVAQEYYLPQPPLQSLTLFLDIKNDMCFQVLTSSLTFFCLSEW
jgi:hypothetical protein